MDPGGNAIALTSRATTWAGKRGHRFKVGMFDALYPLLGPTFRKPLRSLGLMPVHRLGDNLLGTKATYEGAALVEGAWYCAQ